MGLNLNVSNSLSQLVDQLAEKFKQPLPTIFHPHYVVTQTEGMNNWLKIEIAARLGITANVQFLKPNDLITHVYYLLAGPYDQVLGTHSLQWILYEALNDTQFKSKFRHIAQYYDQSDIKRIAMAEKVADLFDQYQIYRPEMIEEWNSSSSAGDVESNWQKYLWLACVEKVGDKMPDKTRIAKFILRSLEDPHNQDTLKNRIPFINFFGISIITSYHLQVFHKLAEFIDVSFNLLNPAPDIYWFEDKSEKYLAKWKNRERLQPHTYEAPIEGNSLLTNWGKVIQDTFGLFFEEDIFLNQYRDQGIEPNTHSLLSKIQNDIYLNAVRDDRNNLLHSDLSDGSLSINSCFTPVREVEVLYNYLTQLVDANPDRYSPRDIVVMVTDIDLYAPFIKAIFDSAPYKYPYAIADERLDQGDSLFGAVNAILQLDTQSLKAEEVIQLLDWNLIKRRFQLNDISLLRQAVDLANIRFGIHGDEGDDTVHVSWQNGLNRIMYGICMQTEDQYCLDTGCFYPVDIAEGERAEELIRFTHFVNVLIDFLSQQNAERTLADWGDYMIRLVNNLIYFAEEEENQDYQVLLSYVEKINLLSFEDTEKISYSVFRHNFLNIISGESRTANFASGGITFCSLIPMRSIPFKIVALLGMNAAQFPRKEIQSGFNMIQQKPKKGDRNLKDNDKHLFLETVLSAQEHLFISYIGKNVKDNTSLPPSILVDELIDYIVSGITDSNEEDALETLVIQHPLHSFTPQPLGVSNYMGIKGHSYDPKSFIKPGTEKREPINELSIQELVSFFKDPFAYYYKQVLNINYDERDLLLRETELFELDRIDLWLVKNDLLILEEEQLSDYIDSGIKKGTLPLKNVAVHALAELGEELKGTKKRLQNYVDGHSEKSLPVALDIDGMVISGNIENIFNDKILMVTFSSDNTKHLLELYIYYLLAQASGAPYNAVLIDHKKGTVLQFSGGMIDDKAAKDRLSYLVQLYRGAHQELFIFHPNFENDPKKLEKQDHKALQKAVENLCKYNYYIAREYQAGLFESQSTFEQYIENSRLVFSDLYAILQH